MPERLFAVGDRVRIVLDATVTDYDEANEDLTVHYSTVLGTYETTVAVDSSYIKIEDLKGGAAGPAVAQAKNLSCQGLQMVDPDQPVHGGVPVEGFREELKRRGEGHVYGCELIGHLATDGGA